MRIEIAHDALAKKIYEKGSSEDKMLLRVIRLVGERHAAFKETRTLLSRKELNFIEPFEKDLDDLVKEDQYKYIEKSRRVRRNQRITSIVALVLVIVGLIGGTVYSNMLKDWAEDAKKEVEKKSKANGLVALAMQNEEVAPELALKLALAAKSETPKDISIDQLSRLIFRRNNFSNKKLSHRGTVYDLAFSPNGKNIATVGMDKFIRLWDMKGNLKKTMTGHTRVINAIDFSPNGQHLVTASDDTTAIIWDIASGDTIRVLRKHLADVNDVKYSPNGQYILTGSRDKTAILWDNDGNYIKTFDKDGHQGNIYAVDFSKKSDRYIATASRDNTVKVWNIKTGSAISTFTHEDYVYGLTFSPKADNIIATGCRDEKIRIWNANKMSEPLQILEGHSGTVVNVAFSPSGDTLASSSWDSSVRLWDLKTEKNVRTFIGHEDYVLGLAYSQNGQYILSGGRDTEARIWDLHLKRNIKNFTTQKNRIQAVAFSPNGEQAITGSWDNSVLLWNIKSKKQIRKYRFPADVEAVAFHPSGDAIGVAYGKKIAVYNLEGKKLYEYKGHTGTVKVIKFSKDGKQILSGGRDNVAILWDIQGKLLTKFKKHSSDVLSVDFSPTQDTIATSSWDKNIFLWTKDGQFIKGLSGHNDKIYAVEYGSEPGQLISAGIDGIRLWDTGTGEIVRNFRTGNYVYDIVFVKNKRDLFLTVGGDNQARLWHTSGNLLQVYEHESDIYSIDIDPNMHYILTGTEKHGAALFYTLEGFLENNHFENITILDKIKFGIKDVTQLNIEESPDKKDIETLRKLAYYLEEQGTKINDLVYLEKARTVHDKITVLSDHTVYDFNQAAALYAKLALAKLVQAPSSTIEPQKLIDRAIELAPNNGEVLLDNAHILMILGKDLEAKFLYEKLKNLTYSVNKSMMARARGELNNLKENGLITETQHQNMKNEFKKMNK